MVRGGTGWYGVVCGGRGGTDSMGVVRSRVINPALDIRSVLLVNGGT